LIDLLYRHECTMNIMCARRTITVTKENPTSNCMPELHNYVYLEINVKTSDDSIGLRIDVINIDPKNKKSLKS